MALVEIASTGRVSDLSHNSQRILLLSNSGKLPLLQGYKHLDDTCPFLHWLQRLSNHEFILPLV
jgi:hypothetical protein